MAEYSRLAKGSFTAASGQTSAVIDTPFTPDYVEVWNLTNIGAGAAASKICRAWWDNKAVVTPSAKSAANTMVELYTSGSVVAFDTIANPNGISTFSAGQMLQYGTPQQIIGITKASPARVNVTAHGYSVGDTVIMQGIALNTTNNMQLLNAVQFTIVTVSDADHFDVQWDTTGSKYTAISGSPAGTLVMKVLYPFLYVPQDNIITALTTGSTTTVQTAEYHNFEVGQEIAFLIPPVWGPSQLNELPNITIPGSPIYGYVQSITDNWTFVCNLNSTSATAFTNNFTMTTSTLVGLQYPQVIPAGDVNTGGNIYSGGNLYPSPQFPTSTNRVATINGPAIRGAFVNNTSSGFIIGSGVAQQNTAGTIVTSSSVILWHAYLHDVANP